MNEWIGIIYLRANLTPPEILLGKISIIYTLKFSQPVTQLAEFAEENCH